MLSQAATATTGVVDTAVMALTGSKTALAAVAVASVVFSFLYWGFGFLRMSTTALTAQALGRDDVSESRAVLARALCIGSALGLSILACGPLVLGLISVLFSVDGQVATEVQAYFNARIWGAPALLTTYGITGWLLGTGRTRQLLAFQVVANATNAVLDIWFVFSLGLGAEGIGAGTAISEWISVGFGLYLVRDGLGGLEDVWKRDRLIELVSANRDIMIRTLSLLFAFGWFVRSGTQISTAVTAGNEVLLQFITVAAFILDGYAFIAEKEAGEAYGAGDKGRLRRAIRVTSELALASGVIITSAYFFLGRAAIGAFVTNGDACQVAFAYLPYCAMVPVIGVAAYQLDGVFLGTTQGAALRNAGILSACLYVVTDIVLAEWLGNRGVWTALLLLYVYRALCLGAYLPRLFSALEALHPRSATCPTDGEHG
jgi:MATE family multidrug resistance protein